MRTMPDLDYETPIEDYPGCIGYTWDGEFHPLAEIEQLSDFEWDSYWALGDEIGWPRKLDVTFGGTSVECRAEEHDLAGLLDQVPSIDVVRDNGPPNGGPASGPGYIFFVAEGHSSEAVLADVAVLRNALEADLQILKALQRDQVTDV